MITQLSSEVRDRQASQEDCAPLRLVHGWGLNSRVFSGFEATLARPTRALDLPGHGRAPYEPGALDPLRVAHAFAGTYQKPGPWLGWSLGGLFAMALAAHYPESVTKLIVVGATPFFVQAADWPYGTELAVLRAFGDQLGREYDATLRRFLTLQAGVGERGHVRQLVSDLESGGRPQAPALSEGLSVLATQDLRKDLRRIRAPALFIHGANDKIVSPEAARWSADRIPGARFCLVGSGHAPFLSAMRECADVVRDFLDE